jgi:uncharacterized protein (DUF2384 family)
MSEQLALVGDGFPTIEKPREPAGVGELRPAYQNRVYECLVDRAIDVFGDESTAARWLSMPSVDLEGKSPTQVAQECDYDKAAIDLKIMPILGKIEHGIYY